MTIEQINKINMILMKENLISLNLDKLNTIDNYLKFQCNTCQTVGSSTIKNLYDVRRKQKLCVYCRTKEKFLKKLNEYYGRNPYEFITTFSGFEAPLTVKCKDCGDIFTIEKAKNLLLNSKLQGTDHPCKKCTKLRLQKTKNIQTDFYDALTSKFGECNYELVEPEKFMGIYSKEKIKIKCKKCGYIMETYIQNIFNPKNGNHYCRVCNHKDRLLERMSYFDRCMMVTNGKLVPLEDYIDSRTPILHKCMLCGYIGKKIPVKNTNRNAGCSNCAHTFAASNEEKDVLNYIQSLDENLKIIENDRNILDGKEIDIYIPSKNIGIEYCGLYWHSESKKGKTYHLDKYKIAQDKKIRLIQIFEDEWLLHPEITKEKIKSILGYNNNATIYARKCQISDLTKDEKDQFLEKYHIQGKDISSYYKCLKFENEIVAVMTFSAKRQCLGTKGHSAENKSERELSRFATAGHMPGAFSRLFKAILKEHPEIKKVITYADLRWSADNSNVYEKNGFKLKERSKPNYWYTDYHSRYHRYNFRKQALKKKFPELYDDKLTEFQIMDKTRYGRIWDCGNLVYEYTVR